MIPSRSVLIVDPADETREVLRTVLQQRGLRIFEARRAEQGLELARQVHPDLIVLDLEIDGSGDEAAGQLARQSRDEKTPLLLLGTARRSAPELADGQFVRKPYHYGPLVRRIESLLADSSQSMSPAP